VFAPNSDPIRSDLTLAGRVREAQTANPIAVALRYWTNLQTISCRL
jgi:hypothetical protein